MLTISIVTPSFNQVRFVEETIRSVVEQDYTHVDYLVIDGGSTDGSREVIARNGERLSYWVSEPDRGQSHAINKGLALTRGDILAYLNSDDVYLPHTLARVARYFEDHPECDILTGGFNVIDDHGATLYAVAYGHCVPAELRQGVNRIGQHSVFWRRRVYEKLGGFDESLHYSMDFDYWVRALPRFTFHHIPDILAGYRVYPEAKTFAYLGKQLAETDAIVARNGASVVRALQLFYAWRLRIIKWTSMARAGYFMRHIKQLTRK